LQIELSTSTLRFIGSGTESTRGFVKRSFFTTRLGTLAWQAALFIRHLIIALGRRTVSAIASRHLAHPSDTEKARQLASDRTISDEEIKEAIQEKYNAILHFHNNHIVGLVSM
jgi:hypothetical protein